MYGKRADGSKRGKASFFEELWAKRNPDGAKQEKAEAEEKKKQAQAEKERKAKEAI